jgi:hypothetical protein
MIELIKTPDADSRSVNGRVTLTKLQLATANHIDHVSKGLEYFVGLLKAAGKKHDHTKSENIEDFHKALESGKIKSSRWYKMHISEERHHLIAKAPDDVNLIDVFEHLVDCVMAGSARSGEIFDIELSNELLQKAHKNTVEMLKKQIKVTEVVK